MSEEFDYRSIPLKQTPTIPDARNWGLERLIPQSVTPTAFPTSFQKTRSHPLGNQYSVGCCVAFSARHGREPIEESQIGSFISLSHMSLYYNRKDTDWQGSGLYPEQAYLALRDFGMAELSVFNIQKEYPDGKVDFLAQKDEILKSAYPHRISAFAQIDINNENELKTALMNSRICVTLEIPIYESFYAISKENPIAPIPNTSTERIFGYHMVCCDGWNDSYNGNKVKVIANSWGTDWGINGGFFYLPEGYPVIVAYALTDDILPSPPDPKPQPTHNYTLTTDKIILTAQINTPLNINVNLLDDNKPLATSQPIQLIFTGISSGGSASNTNNLGVASFTINSDKIGISNLSFIWFDAPTGTKYTLTVTINWIDKVEPKPKGLWHVQSIPINSLKTSEIQALIDKLKNLGYDTYSTISVQIVANSTEALAQTNSNKLTANGVPNIILNY